jgi:hypothetical protein
MATPRFAKRPPFRRNRFAAILPLALATALALAAAANADSLQVTNTADSGAGSLRQAIVVANASPGPDSIGFAAGATGAIELATELPRISSDADKSWVRVRRLSPCGAQPMPPPSSASS